MPKEIEPKQSKIIDYLKLEYNNIFKIPEYQRAYSWTINQCDKLFQDIDDFHQLNSDTNQNIEVALAVDDYLQILSAGLIYEDGMLTSQLMRWNLDTEAGIKLVDVEN